MALSADLVDFGTKPLDYRPLHFVLAHTVQRFEVVADEALDGKPAWFGDRKFQALSPLFYDQCRRRFEVDACPAYTTRQDKLAQPAMDRVRLLGAFSGAVCGFPLAFVLSVCNCVYVSLKSTPAPLACCDPSGRRELGTGIGIALAVTGHRPTRVAGLREGESGALDDAAGAVVRTH
jgi:hypothetical protein